MLTKNQIAELADKGSDLGAKDQSYKCYADLDGSEARRYLEEKGFEVVGNHDTGNNGEALTKCGVLLSTNGFVCRVNITEEGFHKRSYEEYMERYNK